MSVFRCDGCDEFKDADYEGFNVVILQDRKEPYFGDYEMHFCDDCKDDMEICFDS